MFGNFAAEKAFSAVRTTLFTAAFCAALTLQLHAADRPQWTGTFQHLSGFTMRETDTEWSLRRIFQRNV